MASELFPKQKSTEQIADEAFSHSFRGMTDEIDRVANEKVTIWGILVSWIYEKIFRDPFRIKARQNEFEKLRSAAAFDKMQVVFSKEPDSSMSNEQMMNHAERKFRP